MENKQLTPFQKYKKFFLSNLPMAIIFIIVSVIVVLLAVVATETMYFSIPLLLIPTLFAYQVVCSDVEAGVGFTNQGILGSFKRYFVGQWRGCYRVIRSYFYSLLVSLGITVLFMIVYVSVASRTSSAFADAITAISSLTEEELSSSGLSTYIAEYPCLMILASLVELLQGFTFTVAFFHFILSSAPLAILQGNQAADTRGVQLIYRGTIRNNKSFYQKNYYRFAWEAYLIAGLGYLIGAFVSIFIMYSIGYIALDTTTHYLTAAAIAMFGGVLISLLAITVYLPYFFYSVEDFVFELMPFIKDYSVDMAKRNLEELRRLKEISEEEAKQYEEDIKLAEKEFDDQIKDDDKKE